jgi:hypothetical protein
MPCNEEETQTFIFHVALFFTILFVKEYLSHSSIDVAVLHITTKKNPSKKKGAHINKEI